MQRTRLQVAMIWKCLGRWIPNLFNLLSTGKFLKGCPPRASGIIQINCQRIWSDAWKIYSYLWLIQLYHQNLLHKRATPLHCHHAGIFPIPHGGHHLNGQWFHHGCRAHRLIYRVTLKYWPQRMPVIPTEFEGNWVGLTLGTMD